MATKTHTITGWIYLQQYGWQKKGEGNVNFLPFKPEETDDLTLIREHSFEVEVDEDFDPTPQQIAALQEKKRALRLKLAEDLMAIDEKLSKLQAIGNEVQA